MKRCLLVLALTACGGEDPAEEEGDAGPCMLATEAVEPPEGATLAFMDPCTPGNDAECETNLCFNFNARGPHCTVACTRDCECPAPSSGCSNNGVCKSH